MILLINFILGILFVEIGIPLLEGITGLLLTILEAAKGYFNIKITEYNQRIKQTCNPEVKQNAIGFSYTLDEGDLDTDEEIL